VTTEHESLWACGRLSL